MICYRLRCADGHQFEGWYRDSATFSRLREAGMLSCAECGMAAVDQAPMAPAIVSGGRRQEAAAQVQDTPAVAGASGQNQSAPPWSSGPEPLSVSVADRMLAALWQLGVNV